MCHRGSRLYRQSACSPPAQKGPVRPSFAPTVRAREQPEDPGYRNWRALILQTEILSKGPYTTRTSYTTRLRRVWMELKTFSRRASGEECHMWFMSAQSPYTVRHRKGNLSMRTPHTILTSKSEIITHAPRSRLNNTPRQSGTKLN